MSGRFDMKQAVKPVRTEAEHDAALVEIQNLWGSAPGTAKGDKLDVLIALVESYERRQPQMKAADPIELIRFQMQERGLQNSDLAHVIGPANRVSEVLNRRRPLTLDMIRRLQEKLGLPASALVQPYRLSKPRPQRGRPRKAA
jgi:HTH-type transcriptional regulator/antitoxin HigA